MTLRSSGCFLAFETDVTSFSRQLWLQHPLAEEEEEEVAVTVWGEEGFSQPSGGWDAVGAFEPKAKAGYIALSYGSLSRASQA